MLHLNLLGAITLSDEDGHQVRLPARKEEALLAFLATENSHAHSRESLMGLLWPDSPPDKARLSLRVNLSTLKKRLKPLNADGLLSTSSLEIRFCADQCVLDIVKFNQLLRSGDGHAHRRDELCDQCFLPFARAVDLYRGAFLDGFYVDGCQAYEEWLFMQRERFRVLHLDALEKLTDYHQRRSQLETALAYARRQLEVDPLREPAHQRIMQIHLAQGDRAAALRQYERCRAVLEDELGLAPSIEIQELHQQIQARPTAQATAAILPVRTSAPSGQVNLPVYLTPFIGRQDELDLLAARIHQGTYRLISLVGAGGMGKTRLVVEAARRQVDHFADGVYFAPLASVEQAQDVAGALASSLRGHLSRCRAHGAGSTAGLAASAPPAAGDRQLRAPGRGYAAAVGDPTHRAAGDAADHQS
ncbi:MAG: BTAD domain-containing putative transcriptional regulator [Caldilineaceae bacterium]